MRRIGTLAVALTLLAAAPASADTFTVTTTNDGGACNGTSCQSIRAALTAASQSAGPDIIRVPAGVHQLTAGQLQVGSSVTISGAGARMTTVTGNAQSRVFNVGAVDATIAQLTVTGGSVGNVAPGGNVLNTGGNLTLDHVRVTDGKAGGGGGVANVGGTMTIASSLIDGNDLTDSDGSFGAGGGVLNFGQGAPASLTVRDSTITDNIGWNEGAGISSRSDGNGSSAAILQRVTVALNRTTNSSFGGTGGIAWDGVRGSFTVFGSILSGNTTNAASGPPVQSNCSTPAPSSGGGNVVGTADCPFTAAGDLVGVNPLLSPALVNAGGQTDVFTIPGNSPAVDRLAGCVALDQRDVPRPQGAACDAGAFEFNPEPDTSLSANVSSSGRTRTFTFRASEADATFQCRLDGPAGVAAFSACSSPLSYTNLPGGRYTFVVRAVDSLGVPDPTPAATTFDVPRNAVAGQRVVVGEVRGEVRVKVPGGTWAGLSTLTEIPDGSSVDTRNGVVRLSFERKAGGPVQTSKFWDGTFRLRQRGQIMELVLLEKLAKCKGAGDAQAAARRKSRRLWGDGKGRFRTKGRYSSATVRGTKWLTKDSCAGTLTRVRKGRVAVRDFSRRKTINLKKGQGYLARPKP